MEQQQRNPMPHEIHAEGHARPNQNDPQPTDAASWVDGFFDLVSSRIALIQVEAQQVASRNIGRAVMLAGAASAVVVAWFLLMAGIVGVFHAFTGFAWYWTCLIIAGIHLLAVVALIRGARASGPPTFEHTRSEFKKDREWLQNLQHRKSKP